MKKVLLVNPHQADQGGFSNAPLGLLYLAGYLKKNAPEIDVKLVDGYLDRFAGIKKTIDKYKPDVVGITSYTPGRHKALEVAKYVKSTLPDTMVVLGGAHPTIMWKQLLENYDEIDVCVLGEGEVTFLEVLQDKNWHKIQGIAFKDFGKVKATIPRKYVENLDDIPFPDWSKCELDRYPVGGGVMDIRGNKLTLNQVRIPLVTSRGCTGHCTFCSTWWIWRGYRHRSGNNVVDEIQLLYDNGYHHFVLEDDAMTLERQPVMDMCEELIKRDLKIGYFCTTRVDAMDDELAEKLRQSGCYGASIGVESASPKILKNIAKDIDVEMTKKAVSSLQKAGIKICALVMVGNVGETYDTINDTVALLRELDIGDIGTIGRVWVLPGTQLYAYCKKKGMIADDYWLNPDEVFVYKEGFNDVDLGRWHGAICTKKFVNRSGVYSNDRPK